MKHNTRSIIGLFIFIPVTLIALDAMLGKNHIPSPGLLLSLACLAASLAAFGFVYRRAYGDAVIRAALALPILLALTVGWIFGIDLRPTIIVLVSAVMMMNALSRAAEGRR